LTDQWNGTTKPNWYHYFLSGWIGAQTYLKTKGNDQFSGLNLLVYGEVPPAAGLSSSSALVCASVLSTLIAYTNRIFDGYTKVIFIRSDLKIKN
jgi:galactokinase